MMYIELPGGARHPDGYIVPCEPTGRESGGQVQVVLRGAPPYQRHEWTQWVRKTHLLTEDEVAET